MAASGKKSVLFVCLGNICRSPIAEAVFAHMVKEKGLGDKWTVDSAATSGWEIGSPPDSRGQKLLKSKAIPFSHIARQWHIDSGAMMGWHTGNRPDGRGLACLKKHGVETKHRAREVTKDDFKTFDFIFGMDEENMSDLKSLSPKDSTAKVQLLGSYDPEKQLIIQDPYYGGDEGFETVYQQCTRCCKAFLDEQS